jgi:hypothetical protein
MAKAKDISHLRLRIDPARLARLEKYAEKNGRTLTGEIIHRLDESFKKDDFMAFVDRLSDQVTVKVTEVLKQGPLTVTEVLKQGRRHGGDEQ